MSRPDWNAMGREAELTAGEYLWHQDDPASHVVLLLEGELDVLEESFDGETVVFHTLSAGALLGEMSCLDGSPHSASVRARSACRIRNISPSEFRAAVRGCPDLLEELLNRQSERVRRLTRQMARLGFESVKVRLARKLLEMADQANPIEATHQELAARVAATRESVTKALGALSRSGFVKLSRQKVEVVDRAGLARTFLAGN